MLNIYTLHYFFVTGQHLNFSKAAKHLYITQPALSKQIQQLEDQLQVKLFDRTKRSVKLTDAGGVLMEKCKDLFSTIGDLEAAMDQFRDEVRGNLRIAATPSLGNYILPDFLKAFSSQFPHIMLHTIFKSAEEISHMLKTGELDFAFLSTDEQFPGLESKSMKDQKLVFICSSTCEHACQTSTKNKIAPSELELCRFIAFERRSLTRKSIDKLVNEYGIKLNNVAESENIEIIKSMVVRGMGGSIVPECTISYEKSAKLLNVKNIEGVAMARPVSLYFNQELRLSKAHREFLNIFQSFSCEDKSVDLPEKTTKKTPVKKIRTRSKTATKSVAKK